MQDGVEVELKCMRSINVNEHNCIFSAQTQSSRLSCSMSAFAKKSQHPSLFFFYFRNFFLIRNFLGKVQNQVQTLKKISKIFGLDHNKVEKITSSGDFEERVIFKLLENVIPVFYRLQ